jgi:hypothetical protein
MKTRTFAALTFALAALPASALADGGQSITAAPAAAATKPKVSLTLPVADAGAKGTFSWTASRVKRSHRLVLQRQVGTGKVWRTMRRLSKRGGSGSLPAFTLGAYRLRIAVFDKHRAMLTQQQKRLYVFGRVPFSALFRQSGGIYTMPTQSFEWRLKGDAGQEYETFITVRRSPCRSVHVDFVGHLLETGPDETVTATIAQESRDAVSATAQTGTVGAVDATVVPGQSWSLNMTYNGTRWDSIPTYVNGSASCFSAKDLS